MMDSYKIGPLSFLTARREPNNYSFSIDIYSIYKNSKKWWITVINFGSIHVLFKNKNLELK